MAIFQKQLILKPVLGSALLFAVAITAPAQDRAQWMREAKWGVMSHYLADWQARVHNLDMNVPLWNKLVDNFDVETLAGQLQSAGVRYYQLTIRQNSGYYVAPTQHTTGSPEFSLASVQNAI